MKLNFYYAHFVIDGRNEWFLCDARATITIIQF